MRLQKLKCREKNVKFQTKSPKKYKTISNDVAHKIRFRKKNEKRKEIKSTGGIFQN